MGIVSGTFLQSVGMTTSTEDEIRAMKGTCPVHAWKTRRWMKRLHQRDWHRPGMHPGMLATDRIKWHHLPQQGSDERNQKGLRILQGCFF